MLEWSNFTIIFNWDISFTLFTSSLLSYFAKKTAWKGRFCIFFICMLMSKKRPVRVVVGHQLFLRGREVKGTVLRTPPKVVWLWFWVVRGQVKSNSSWWGFNSHLLSWPDLSLNHPKLKSKLGVVCTKTLGSTAGPRRKTLMPKVFN